MTCVIGVLSFKISEICRICLRKENELINIFYPDEGSFNRAKLIWTFGKNPVNVNDGLPEQICKSCDDKLRNCYKFIQNIQRTYEILCGSIINPDRTTKSELPEDITNFCKKENAFRCNENCQSRLTQVDTVSIVCRPKVNVKNNILKKQAPTIKTNINRYKALREQSKNNHKIGAALQRLHKNRTKCPLCLQTVGDNEIMVEHFYAHYITSNLNPLIINGKKNILCNLCNKTFRYNTMVPHHRSHLNIHPFGCVVEGCEKKFVCSQYLSRHLDQHNGMKKYQCQTCGKTFGLRSTLQNHEETHVFENVQCKICNKIYKNDQLLKRHMKRHNNGLKFQCTFPGCTKVFCLPQELNRHHQTHTKTRSHICEICSKSWFSRGELQRHARYHSTVREHQCGHCTKTFVEKTHLKLHERTHNGDRPYVCEFCLTTFISQSKLKRHQIKPCKQTKS